MAPTIGRVALDNGFHGSIPGDWVAPPPQNIQMLNISSNTVSKAYSYMCREGLVQHTKHGRFTVIYDRVLIKKARTGAAKSLCYAYYFGMNDLGYTKQESDIIIQKFIKEFPDKNSRNYTDNKT